MNKLKIFPEINAIGKDEIANYPLACYEKKIVLVDADCKVEQAIECLKQESQLGFDTETRPSFKKGRSYSVALLQLGTEDCVYLFRLQKLSKLKPIAQLLADKTIVKAGVAIHDDIKSLQKKMLFRPGGFVELQEKVKEFGIENFGLRRLPPLLLGFRISKNQQLSNWEASRLSENQMRYAATDAWVSLLIYRKLEHLNKEGH